LFFLLCGIANGRSSGIWTQAGIVNLSNGKFESTSLTSEGKIVLDGEPKEIFNSEQAWLLGVGIPKAVHLWRLLEEAGVPIKGTPTSSEEAVQLLKEVLLATIEVNDVHFTYSTGVEALKGVSLRIEDGEFVAIWVRMELAKQPLLS
jgi:energy-coupling factor transporter ATP-binding protein EcfA2